MSSDTCSDDDDWAQVCAFFGERSVSFLLGLKPGQRPVEGDARRWPVVRHLAQIQVEESTLKPEQKLSLRARILTRVLVPHKITFFEAVRETLGIPTPAPTGDALEDGFCRLVLHGLMIEQLDGAINDRFLVAASFQDPALYDPVATALLKDDSLVKLFPQREPNEDASRPDSAMGLLYWTPFGGGTTDLRIVVGAVVEQTLARMRFEGSLEEPRIAEYVQQSLAQLRQFAAGETIEVVVLTGLLHISVDGYLDRGSWGIRSASGLAIETYGEPQPAPETVIWHKVPFRLVACERNDIGEPESNQTFAVYATQAPPAMSHTHRVLDTIRYGIVAWALLQNKRVNVACTAPWDLLPVRHTSHPFVVFESEDGAFSLSQQSLDEIADIVDLVMPANASMTIALRRILRSFSEQRDPVDALIDAVIAWENMLGSTAETTFKVCSALAWLIEPEDATARAELFGRCSRIYNTRSRLVHGDSNVEESDASELVDEAIRIAATAFRLIHSNPQLRSMNKSSKRSQRLILGADIH